MTSIKGSGCVSTHCPFTHSPKLFIVLTSLLTLIGVVDEQTLIVVPACTVTVCPLPLQSV